MSKINKSDIDLSSVNQVEDKKPKEDEVDEKIMVKLLPPKKQRKKKQVQLEPVEKEVVEVDDSDSKQKQRLIYQIIKYQDSQYFKHIVVDRLHCNYNYDQLNKKKIDDLQDILNRIRTNINQDALDKFYEQAVEGTSYLFERSLSSVYNIDGFTDNLLTNEQFHIIMERYKIETDLPEVPLGLQLSHIILTTALSTHMLNNMPQKSIVNEEVKTMSSPAVEISDLIEPEQEKKPKKKKRPDFL